jgi:hypothetical protein
MKVFAQDLSAQAERLWSHLPEDLVPGEDDQLGMRTDSLGNLMIAHGENIYLLRDDVAWVYSMAGLEALSAYKDREPVGDALIMAPQLDG